MTQYEQGLQGPKSIPVAKAVITPVLAVNVGDAVGGTSAAQVFDADQESYHEGLLLVEVKTVNGQGETPTSPGAGKKITVKVAFADEQLELADAATILATAAITTVECTLPNSTSTGAAGTRIYQSDPFVHRGRYIYVWYSWEAFAADALVATTVKLVRL